MRIIVTLFLAFLFTGSAFAQDNRLGELRLVNKLDGFIFQSIPVFSPDEQLVFVEAWNEDDENQRFYLFIDLTTGKIRCKIKKGRYVSFKSLHFDTPTSVSFINYDQLYRVDSLSCSESKTPNPVAKLVSQYRFPIYGTSTQTSRSHLRWNKNSTRRKLKDMGPEESLAALIPFDGSEVITFSGHDKGIRQAVLSPNGQQLVTLSEDNSLRIWNALSGEPIKQISFKDEAPTDIRFTPDGNFIVTYSHNLLSNDRLSYLINLDSGKIERKLDSGSKASKSARKGFKLTGKNAGAGHFDIWFSPDGSQIYAQRGLKEIQVFDHKTGKAKGVLDAVRWVGQRTDCSHCLYFPALSENAVHIYNAATMEREISTDGKYLQDHYDQCGYYSDGRNALIMSNDGRIVIHQVGSAMFIWQWDP